MSPAQELIGIALLIGAACWICKYYWARIIACGIILAIWAAVTVAAPIYLAWEDFSKGRIFAGLFTLIICQVIAIPFYIAAKAAIDWTKNEIKSGRWTKRPINWQ